MFIVSVEGAIYKGDEWLIIRRSEQEEHAAGLLSLVGGKVEKEGFVLDVLEKTLVREIDEEVGIKIKENMQYIYSVSFETDQGEKVVNIIFLCEYESGRARAKSIDEVDEVHWLTTDDILSLKEAPDYVKESIRRANALKVKCL